MTEKKPLYKRTWFIVTVVVVGLFILIGAFAPAEDAEPKVETKTEKVVEPAPSPTKEPVEKESKTPEPLTEEPTLSADEKQKVKELAYIAVIRSDVPNADFLNDAQLEAVGKTTCELFDKQGVSPASMVGVGTGLVEASENSLTLEDAGYIMGAAVETYCPEYTKSLQSASNSLT